jgi:hypothetical protein
MVRAPEEQKITEGLARRKLPKYSVISNWKAMSVPSLEFNKSTPVDAWRRKLA